MDQGSSRLYHSGLSVRRSERVYVLQTFKPCECLLAASERLTEIEQRGVEGTERVLAGLLCRIGNDDETTFSPCGEEVACSALGDAEEILEMAAGNGCRISKEFQSLA